MTKRQEDEPQTQQTEHGLTIPVPSREDVEDALTKLSKPSKRRGGLDDGGSGEDRPSE